MADKKSRGVIGTGMTDHGQYYVEYSDGTREAAISGGDNEVRIAEDDDKLSDISIRITADVAEAITGFKALQRELRETTKATREMEQAYISLSKTGLTPSEIISMTGEEAENYLARHAIIIDGKAVGKVIAPDEVDVSTKEAEMTYYDLSEVPTKQLHEELAKREGVREVTVGPHGESAAVKLYVNGNEFFEDMPGPARILINKD